MYEFLALLAPQLTRRLVDRAHSSDTQAEIDMLFPDVPLATRTAC